MVGERSAPPVSSTVRTNARRPRPISKASRRAPSSQGWRTCREIYPPDEEGKKIRVLPKIMPRNQRARAAVGARAEAHGHAGGAVGGDANSGQAIAASVRRRARRSAPRCGAATSRVATGAYGQPQELPNPGRAECARRIRAPASRARTSMLGNGRRSGESAQRGDRGVSGRNQVAEPNRSSFCQSRTVGAAQDGQAAT